MLHMTLLLTAMLLQANSRQTEAYNVYCSCDSFQLPSDDQIDIDPLNQDEFSGYYGEMKNKDACSIETG